MSCCFYILEENDEKKSEKQQDSAQRRPGHSGMCPDIFLECYSDEDF